MKLRFVLSFVVALLFPATSFAQDPENTLYLDTAYGRVVIEMLPQVAPNHVERIKKLVREGYYNGNQFFRVIDGFMAQTGDTTNTGTGESSYPDLKQEFSNESFTRGAVGMARTSDSYDTANSQFFICFADSTFLDGQYTLWGRVTQGIEFVDKIKRGEPPANPDIIVKIQVAADAK